MIIDIIVTRGNRDKKGIKGKKKLSSHIYKGLFSAENLKEDHTKLWEMQQKVETTNIFE